ncbi:MAG: plasmid pRiA4b family protein [Bacteroidetes bacterium]|nr:plasmid pRiA4b family protein [Bacteroidota bacterium]
MIFQFKIQIKGITKPPVWRKIAVPADFTFLRFHEVIQEAFGWENDHLFEFEDKEYESSIRISIPSEDDFDFGVKTQHASKIKLSKIFSSNSPKLLYVYDFGDSWVHEIILEAITDDNQKRAVCLSGKGACPPEDCGGIYGYEEMQKVFQTMPKSEQADKYREWLDLEEDEVWDADSFNIDEVNTYLKQV